MNLHITRKQFNTLWFVAAIKTLGAHPPFAIAHALVFALVCKFEGLTVRTEFALGQQDRGLGEFGHGLVSHDKSTVLSVHLLLTFLQPITQMLHPALRTWAIESDSAIFFERAEMLE